ncbi:DUF3800 domain-containing protein [Microbacterium sp. NPDC058389]|uniref:DUF3800 domain-containing protein n=1 Tax=Microbacterium sp. NPDC058389 TaxID=3346475 RepID=UPI003661F8B8
MSNIANIYCDESLHLPGDAYPVMVLGGIACPLDSAPEIAARLREIRAKHELPAAFEIKWTKVSPAKLEYYEELIEYFFSENNLRFRAVIADKTALNHESFGQTHDDWYYKMMYQLLTRFHVDGYQQRIYLDKKDSRSGTKVRRLHDILSRASHDFDKQQISRLQIVQSHEVIQMQLADLLIGAIGYANRHLSTSTAKLHLIERIEKLSNTSLTRSTSPSEKKFNLFRWTGRS